MTNEQRIRRLERAVFRLGRELETLRAKDAAEVPALVRTAAEAAAKVFDVHPAEIFGRARHAQVIEARRTVWWILREQHHLSLPRIGMLTGRNHGTVHHGLIMLGSLKSCDARLNAKVQQAMEAAA